MLKDEFLDGLMLYTSNFGTTLPEKKANIQYRHNFEGVGYDEFLLAIDHISESHAGQKFPGMAMLRKECQRLERPHSREKKFCPKCSGVGLLFHIFTLPDDVQLAGRQHIKACLCDCRERLPGSDILYHSEVKGADGEAMSMRDNRLKELW